MHNQRNIILAFVLTAALLFGWNELMTRLYPQPEPTPAEVAASQQASSGEAAKPTQHARHGGLVDPAQIALEVADLKTALATPDRIRIDAPRLGGSIKLTGALVDDLVLKDHRETTDKDSPPVRMFSPAGTPAQQFAQFGWVGSNIAVPGPDAVWQADGKVLTPATPVTLRWSNGQGQTFAIKLSVDDTYLLTATQTVANTGAAPVALQPFALVNRTSRNASQDIWNIHSGPIGNFGGKVDFDTNYDDVDEAGKVAASGRTGWAGFTDIYWMTALVPQQGAITDTTFRSLGRETYRADVIYDPVSIPAGRQVTTTTRLFAGAKDSKVLDMYEGEGISNLGLAVDWGWFRWFEKPILAVLKAVFELTGNFGIAIIVLTIIVRGLMFPIAQKQFKSMAAMKAIQPKQKAIQDRWKDDKQKQQQEIMALYKSEGVNPLAGCLPILVQIPVFFALYKVLVLGIEMRHQPFLYIKDLSAPDPATILNLFGLLPFTPPSFLAIGILALLLGVTMWLTFKLNPAAADPVQQQMFSIMPWIMMFIMAPFAAGLLLYWVTSNVLTLAQQRYLYSKHPALRAQAEADKAKVAAEKA